MTIHTGLPESVAVSYADPARGPAESDREALAGIYKRYGRPLYNYCLKIVGDRDEAADCVQDVFCTASAEMEKLRDPARLRPWLYATARHTALRHRHERRHEPPLDTLPESTGSGPGPITLAARSELAALISQAAEGLSERDHHVLELAYRHGLTGPELADALGVSHDAAAKLVQRLRDTMARSLGALLVARRAREHGCPQLSTAVAGSDGKLTVQMRKSIARHVDSCPTCNAYRRSVVAMLGGSVHKRPA